MTRDDRLAELLERWEAAAATGSHPTPEEVCRDTPDDLPAFRELLRQLGQVGLMTGGRRDAPTPTPAAGFRADRYVAEEFHAAGGLGVVYRARDEELNRTVALKCMKTAAPADSPAGRRFLMEAEVTSRLEHPGIAPVHGRGRTSDGRPFYAMRFVHGETLQDSARRFHAPGPGRERNVERRRLLRAFVGVCQTVAYAHSKGVIHRDLKPSNVMVGPFGEVLVVDWGLASETRNSELGMRNEDPPTTSMADAAERTSEFTVTGRAKGSPAFMSPEQARGDWGRVGPPSDVYSLGSTLYYLLTGQVPYDGRSGPDVVASVRAGRFPPPRQVNASVPPALDAVCRKAMAFAPGDRYETARALAEDVERWLADEPVTAWREPLAVRARRWVKRHRTLVTATSAALVVGFVLLAVAGYRLDRKNAELREARDREVALRIEAEEQRRLADERFAQALGATTTLVTDVQIKLVRSPATRAVRESILKDALARLNQLIKSTDQPRGADHAMVLARVALGDLYRDVELRPDKAIVEYTRGLELARAVQTGRSGDPAAALDVIKVLQKLGAAEYQVGHVGRAVECYADAARLIAAVGPPADEARARNLYQQGKLALETGDGPTAVARLNESRTLWEARADPEAGFALGEVLLALGDTADRTGRPTDAIIHNTAALVKWRELEARRPADVTIKLRLAWAHHGLARANTRLGRRDAAGAHARTFFDLAKALADQDPENGEALLAMAVAHGGLALDAALRFDVAAADDHFRHSWEVIDRLIPADRTNLDLWRNPAIVFTNLGQVARARRQYPDAADRFQDAINIHRELVRIAPARALARADLAEWLKEKGLIHLRHLPDKEAGLAALAESRVEWETLARLDPANRAWQTQALEVYRELGRWHRTGPKAYDRADEALSAGLGAADRVPPADRDHPTIRRAVGLLRVEVAHLKLARARRDEAATAADREIESLAGKADDWVACELLERNHAFLADLHRQTDPAKSAKHTRLAADAARRGLALEPDRPEFRQALQIHLGWLGDRRLEDDPAAALALFREALAHAPHLPPDLAETAFLRTRLGALEVKAGDCCEMLNKAKEAVTHYTAALEHHTQVVADTPDQPGARAALAYDHRRLAELRMWLLDFPGSVAEYEKARAVLDKMKADKVPLGVLGQPTEKLVATNLPFVKSLPKGVETLDATLKQPAGVRPDALRLRVSWMLSADRVKEAAETAEALAKETAANGEARARAAVEFARLAARPGGDGYAARAVELLKEAKAAGYFRGPADTAWLKWEPLFEPLRERPAFQELSGAKK